MKYLIDPVSGIARSDGARIFAVLPGTVLRYEDIERQIAYAVQQLHRNGLASGNTIALYQPGAPPEANDVLRWVILIIAAIRCGITVAPLSRHLPPNAILPLLEQLGGAVLVGADGLKLKELTDGEVESSDLYTWTLDREATVIFTSGSTGAPKAAVHTLGNHYWSAVGWAEYVPVTMNDRWLLNLPLNHVGGLAMVFRALFAGGSIAIPDPAKSLVEALSFSGSTMASAVPTQLARALKETDDRPPETLKMLLLGGAASSLDMISEAREYDWPLCASYGMTEMASTIAATQVRANREHANAGQVLLHREVVVADSGEVMLRGKTLFAGYRNGSELEIPFDENGWFPSGDLGEWIEIEGEPHLRLIGRKDNRFISGGENIQPEAIERVLTALPGIRQAIIVPVANAEFGERPVAFVDAETWEPDVWISAIRATLPSFYTPDRFLPWPEEVSNIDKPNRTQLAELAAR